MNMQKHSFFIPAQLERTLAELRQKNSALALMKSELQASASGFFFMFSLFPINPISLNVSAQRFSHLSVIFDLFVNFFAAAATRAVFVDTRELIVEVSALLEEAMQVARDVSNCE